MANLTGDRPVWFIDTASATAIEPATKVVKIKGVHWVGATTAGHQVIVTDGQGRRVWASKAFNTPNPPEADTPSIPHMWGLIVPTLDSGELYLEMG
jgi:hypothetical protein